ncbi:MAG TPA: YiiX/YebB-like N1pC/P60 family cysteine hydrolase, partial [Polyangiaceae bacterium]|nr:YiiX/YebB-like N1pC/P60 family cysteine hydrolase [Polyangiaceae bacterium]
RTEQTYRAELQRLKRSAVGLWYPVQKRAAEILGDTRVRRPGRYLIARAMRDYVDERLEPGDILLSRKNWYLSNVGLPGFWPHAMLYLGDPKKLDGYFEGVSLGDERSMSAHLSEHYPNAWNAYLADGHGEPQRVIEAVSEGVVFSTLEHCAGDYFAAMRPRLDKHDKAMAIAFAFAQHEKPYDFDFDFATDHALVCTELVWRSYRPAKERSHAIDFSLVPVAGRMTLPANELALKYAREAGTAAAQLDFVVFVDAREDLGEAFVSSEEAFRASARRTKWDIAQE